MPTQLPSGTHIRMLLAGCRCSDQVLRFHASLLTSLEETVRACEMTPLASAGHDFEGAGHSLCLVLAESHLAIHTYPECDRSVVVEITICDHQRDNRERARRLADRLQARFEPTEVGREEHAMAPSLGPGTEQLDR